MLKIFYSKAVCATRRKSEKFEHLNPCLFNAMEDMTGKDWYLASPTGFEPVLPP